MLLEAFTFSVKDLCCDNRRCLNFEGKVNMWGSPRLTGRLIDCNQVCHVVARPASGGTGGTCIDVHTPAGIPTDKGSYRFTVRHCAGMDVI